MPSPASDPTKLVGFAVYNGFNPKEKPKALAVSLDFTAAAVIPIDLTIAEQEGRFRFVQAVYIDNSTNPSPLSLTVGLTQQVVTMPAYSQGYLPLLCPNPAKLSASLPIVGAGNNATIIQFLNFPVPLATWKVDQPPRVILAPANVVGGVSIALNNPTWFTVTSLTFIYSASATVGNRAVRATFFQGSVLIAPTGAGTIYRAAAFAAVVASENAFFSCGQSLPSGAIPPGQPAGTSNDHVIPLPVGLLLPPNTLLNLIDGANIDPNDSTSTIRVTGLDVAA